MFALIFFLKNLICVSCLTVINHEFKQKLEWLFTTIMSSIVTAVLIFFWCDFYQKWWSSKLWYLCFSTEISCMIFVCTDGGSHTQSFCHIQRWGQKATSARDVENIVSGAELFYRYARKRRQEFQNSNKSHFGKSNVRKIWWPALNEEIDK